MINALTRNHSRYLLVGKINGLSQEAIKARKRFFKAVKADKPYWNLAIRKRWIGISIRHHLLAYAFLRGKEYRTLERDCREDNRPKAADIYCIVQAHAPNYIPYDVYARTGGGKYEVKEEDIVKWLGFSQDET
jgi:hypothetical protein